MIKVAVTGNIGSGKTSVCKVFSCLGVPVLYSDHEAKKLYDNPEILTTISNRLGKGILTKEKLLDKKMLATIIFNDPTAMTFITELIHPLVYEKYRLWLLEMADYPYTIQESALVFETGAFRKFDKTILVHAPEEVLIDRVVMRDNSTRQQALQRLNNQLPQKKKIKMADYTLLNDNTELILPAIIKIHQELVELATKKTNS